MTISSDLDIVRLKVGDTDENDPLLFDDEINYFLSTRSVVLSGGGTVVDTVGAAADAAAAIAAKFARGYNFSTDGQSFNRSERVAHYTALAHQLQRSSGGYSVPLKSSVSVAVNDDLDF